MQQDPSRKYYTPDQAIIKARKYCAFQERSQYEVRNKLREWGLRTGDADQILATLISEGFVAEERFALAFAGGKFRMKKWGRIRIRMALKEKQVSEPLIRKALSEIDEQEYMKTLRQLVRARSRTISEKHPLKRNYKIASYVISRGFEPELVWSLLQNDEV